MSGCDSGQALELGTASSKSKQTVGVRERGGRARDDRTAVSGQVSDKFGCGTASQGDVPFFRQVSVMLFLFTTGKVCTAGRSITRSSARFLVWMWVRRVFPIRFEPFREKKVIMIENIV
ncbi:hypothetical protein ElyMa_001076300 [Elysia marginata]|uniref:Uncharacterized protein n=1 Tax=Elysia marginata TaxID=1093978 RepID=A0AAV4HSF1_9GAST|nr:hypothetical protein ElyMa_001076300 [Elysia marginata]